MKKLRIWPVLALAAILLQACGTGGATPTPTQALPPTPAPTETALPTPSPTVDPRVYFDDHDDKLLVAGNGYYEIGLLKSNGGIAYLRERASGAEISLGSSNGCLWSVASDMLPSGMKSCALGQAFSYAWSEADSRLTLSYPPDPAAVRFIDVTVTLTLSREPWFDLQLTLKNQLGYDSGDVNLPAGLIFDHTATQQALLPVLPGITLEKAFFDQRRSYVANYPGWPGVFADFIALTVHGVTLALYALPEGDRTTPARFGFDQIGCDTKEMCLVHAFRPRLPSGQTWTSPRLRALLTTGWEAAIAQFRADDGLEAGPALEEKLGRRHAQTLRSPLYKADTAQIGLPFSQYAPLLDSLPQPGLLHVVAYSPGGFDRSYPDLLPPDPRWGTTAEMAGMFQEAQARGFLVMPYTNPTWWDGQSFTLQNLPSGTTLKTLAALSVGHDPIQECYGCPNDPHNGYVVSPFADFVRVRLDALMRQMTTDLPSDMVFEDQIGARPAVLDFNPAAPRPDAYLQGWVEHARAHQGARLATEDGFDRLVDYEVGFHGSTLLSERRGEADGWWGANTWRPYPFGGMAAGDRVLFYQHNLAPESFTHNLSILTWNAAMGSMLSYDLVKSDFGGGRQSDWLALAADFQRYVLGEFTGERILGYQPVAQDVTRTDYAHFSVTANWSEQNPYAAGEHILPPLGLLVQKDDGSLTAGVYTTYNGQALEGGGHALIEERGESQIVIRQPLGNDTPLAVKGLAGWTQDTPLVARAFSRDEKELGSRPVTLVGQAAVFTYQKQWDGGQAAYYTLGPAAP